MIPNLDDAYRRSEGSTDFDDEADTGPVWLSRPIAFEIALAILILSSIAVGWIAASYVLHMG